MNWTLVLVGAVVAYSLLDHLGGAAIGAAIGYLFGRLLNLDADLRTLREELRLLRAANAGAQQVKEKVAAAEKSAAVSDVLETAPAWPVDEPISKPVASATVQPPPLPQAPIAPRAPQPAATPSWITQGMDWIRGGNPLARVGIVILFFGGAFLAKYAAEHTHFPIGLRMAALAVGAFVLLAIGWGLRNKRAVYAQTLQGGGIAGL